MTKSICKRLWCFAIFLANCSMRQAKVIFLKKVCEIVSQNFYQYFIDKNFVMGKRFIDKFSFSSAPKIVVQQTFFFSPDKNLSLLQFFANILLLQIMSLSIFFNFFLWEKISTFFQHWQISSRQFVAYKTQKKIWSVLTRVTRKRCDFKKSTFFVYKSRTFSWPWQRNIFGSTPLIQWPVTADREPDNLTEQVLSKNYLTKFTFFTTFRSFCLLYSIRKEPLFYDIAQFSFLAVKFNMYQ